MDESLKAAFSQVRFRSEREKVPGLFFIVTACKPDGVNVPVEENKRADGILKETVDEAGFDSFRVVGGDFEFDHSEPGWGICCGLADARKLSERFRQVAFFEVNSGMVRLVPTDPSDGDAVDLGDWDLRLDDGKPCWDQQRRPLRFTGFTCLR